MKNGEKKKKTMNKYAEEECRKTKIHIYAFVDKLVSAMRLKRL